jgi:hypothetical protein
LEEYLKAEPYLTIDPSMRLIQENQILKVNIDKYEYEYKYEYVSLLPSNSPQTYPLVFQEVLP